MKLVRACASLLVSLLLVPMPEARADGVEISITAARGTSVWDGPLHSSDEEPDVLANAAPQVTGTTNTTNLGIQITGVVSETRFGLSESLFLPKDLTVRMGPLPRDFEIKPGVAWGGRIEGFVGREFARYPHVVPWIDLAFGVSMLGASFSLRHATLGGLGDTHYVRVEAVVAPRIGLRIPLGRSGAIDFFARKDLLGPDQLMLGVALGVGAFTSAYDY